jgi:hypothetical protein
MVTIENPGPRILEADIRDFERRIGEPLPEEYRRFLLEFNGGAPSPDTIDIEGLPGSSVDVQVFFGIGRAVTSSGIEWNMATLAARLKEGLLPIACDSGGSVFCLSLKGCKRGTVFYCDLESAFADFDSEPSLYPVASSFDEFLKKLRAFC